jgi:low temperature requirement protein LtrA
VSAVGKRVSWVELYLDLIFVLAVGELAHVIEAHPHMSSVWIALGLFVTLWWTWIGFAVLYNRYGDDAPAHRLIFLAGSIPAGLAAVALEPASAAHATVFALSMAIVRVVLAVAHGLGGHLREVTGERVFRAYMVSALLWTISIWVPAPWRYVLWGVAIGTESGAALTEDKQAVRRARRDRDIRALAPASPAEALDSHHFAERFGLFLIILLGEVVISAGDAAIQGEDAPFSSWAALVAAMLPAFSLLITAAGLGLLLGGEAEKLAYWLPGIGIGIYLAGTRVIFGAGTAWGRALRTALVIATFLLGSLHDTLSPHAYVWLLAAWAIGCAALATRSRRFIPAELGG